MWHDWPEHLNKSLNPSYATGSLGYFTYGVCICQVYKCAFDVGYSWWSPPLPVRQPFFALHSFTHTRETYTSFFVSLFQSLQTPGTGLRHPSFEGRHQKASFLEDLKCWGAWDITCCGHKARDTTSSHLEERGVERGSARLSSLTGRERAIVGQTNIGTVSKATFGKLLWDKVERIWTFPSA